MSLPPHDLTAERSVLASILVDPVTYPLVSHLVTAPDFYGRDHSALYASMTRLASGGVPIDSASIRADMTRAGTFAASGGDTMLADLWNGQIIPEHIEAHAKAVRDLSRRRALIAACRHVAEMGMDGALGTTEFLTDAEADLYRAMAMAVGTDAYLTMPDAVQRTREQNAQAAAERGAVLGITTGIESLDHELKGMRKGELIVIGGRTSEGKSILAMTIARNNAIRGKRSAYFSLEMPHEDMVQRLVAMEGVSIAQQESYSYAITPATNRTLREAYNAVEALPIEMVYKPRITIPHIRTYCRRMMVDKPVDLVIVDYLALLGATEKSENRNREVASFTGALLELACDLKLPVIAIQSLNRKSAEDGSLKRPQISHLMDSSSIEYDAHKVLLVHNPNAKHDDKRSDDTGEREIIIAKNRRGRRDWTCKVQMHPERFTFADTETQRVEDDRYEF